MFEKKVWNDRQSEHPARRRLTPTENDNEYEVSRAEGLVMEEGDAFDAATMNDLENRVAKAFAEYDPADLGAVNVTVQLYTCKKEGKVYQLTGSGSVGRCKIPAAWASGDTWTVNGTTVPAYCGADTVDGDTIVAGRWVLFTFDGQQLNFNGGGGLSASKLAQATAVENHVIRGRGFYSGGKTLRIGTLPNLAVPKNAGGDASTGLNSQYPNVGVDATSTYWYTTNIDGVRRLCLRPHFGAFGGESGVLGADGYVGIEANVLGTASAAQVLEGASFTSGQSGSAGAGGSMPNQGDWSREIVPGGVVTVPGGYHAGGGRVSAKGIKTVEVWQTCGGGQSRFSFSDGTLVGVVYAGSPYTSENILQGAGINSGSEYWAQCTAGTNASVKFVLAYY